MDRVNTKIKQSWADLVLLALLLTLIYSLGAYAGQWKASYNPSYPIDLSLKSLPFYTLCTGLRGLTAYFFSLLFTLIIGMWAAKSPRAEKWIVPLLDIFQSIPVLGFLPGLVLSLVYLFPHTNTGLELASILMIFTGQVWNMAFSFYNSIKSIPPTLVEVSGVIGLSAKDRFFQLELPYAAVNLAWNSIMSMSGGWFFLCVCEAFTLGDQSYCLPGLGSYMATAIGQNNMLASIEGITAMCLLILAMDIVIWRPVIAWTHQYRLDEMPGSPSIHPLMQQIIQNSSLVHAIRELRILKIRHLSKIPNILRYFFPKKGLKNVLKKKTLLIRPLFEFLGRIITLILSLWNLVKPFASKFILIALSLWILFSLKELAKEALFLPTKEWIDLFYATGATLLRVIFSLMISSIWAVPFGIWIGMSQNRVRWTQPIIQLLASFPAPMLYPLVMRFLINHDIPLPIASGLLMTLGVQWYVVFNVLSGAMRIPTELELATRMMNISAFDRWFKLYLPSIFPALITGWITAAGGAWNASIVAEYLLLDKKILQVQGLGATISHAAASSNFALLTAALTLMVLLVLLLNRTFWAWLQNLSQTRFKIDV